MQGSNYLTRSACVGSEKTIVLHCNISRKKKFDCKRSDENGESKTKEEVTALVT